MQDKQHAATVNECPFGMCITTAHELPLQALHMQGLDARSARHIVVLVHTLQRQETKIQSRQASQGRARSIMMSDFVRQEIGRDRHVPSR